MPTLKRIARQTVGTVLHHLPIIHLPTFRLHDVSLPVSFAICTVGSPVHSAVVGDYSRGILPTEDLVNSRSKLYDDWVRGMGVIGPVASSSQITELEDYPSEEEQNFEDRKQVSASHSLRAYGT